MNRKVSKPHADLPGPTNLTEPASTSSPLHSSQRLSRSASGTGSDASAAFASSQTRSKSPKPSKPGVSSNEESSIALMAHLLVLLPSHTLGPRRCVGVSLRSRNMTFATLPCHALPAALLAALVPVEMAQSTPTDHGRTGGEERRSKCSLSFSRSSYAKRTSFFVANAS